MIKLLCQLEMAGYPAVLAGPAQLRATGEYRCWTIAFTLENPPVTHSMQGRVQPF
jgi:hypothetical protein